MLQVESLLQAPHIEGLPAQLADQLAHGGFGGRVVAAEKHGRFDAEGGVGLHHPAARQTLLQHLRSRESTAKAMAKVGSHHLCVPCIYDEGGASMT